MADAFIRLPDDGVGKRLDVESITVNSLLVHRERMQIAGVAADDIAAVLDTDPTAALHALLVRLAETESPKTFFGTVAAVAAGSSGIITTPQITVNTTGKLFAAIASSSVPFKAQLRTVAEGVESADRDVRFGLTRTVVFRVPAKGFVTVLGTVAAGLDAFRLEITNLETLEPADVYATFYWDEV